MKCLIALYTLTFCCLGLANEDHLLLIPTPISNGDGIVIVQKPMISGDGADFEAYCGRITAPYKADVSSPSTKATEEDLNPISRVGIAVSAVLPNDSDRYKVTINYSGATDANTKKDVYLFRTVLTCVYMFGDNIHGHHKLKADVELKGVDQKSPLRAELARFIAQRTRDIERARKENGGESPDRSSVYYVPHHPPE